MSAEAKGRGDDFRQLYEQKEEQQVELIEWILQDRNIDEAIKAVKRNKGAAGVDGMTVDELDAYFALHRKEIKVQIREGQLQAESCTKGLHTQRQWQEEAARDTDSSGQSSTADGGTDIVTRLRQVLL